MKKDDDRFYIHMPDEPDTPPTRPKKPVSRKSRSPQSFLAVFVLLILGGGVLCITLLYLPKLLLEVLPIWHELFSICPPETIGRGVLWVIPVAFSLAVIAEFVKLILNRKPYKTIATGAYALLAYVGNTLRDAVHIFIPTEDKKEEPSPKDPTIPVDIDPDVLNVLDGRLQADFKAARNNVPTRDHKKED